MDFRCAPCGKTFAREPLPTETPFEVPGFDGVFLSGFKGRAVDGRMVIDSAACPQCGGFAPRSCTTTPVPGTYLTLATLSAPCPDCGHATVLHIGVDHCPVCELVDLNQRARDGGRVEVRIQGSVLTEKKLFEAIKDGLRRQPPDLGGIRA
jgi:DNA-directed RNA polymerase subunit RPC12/RpoP